MQYVGQTGRALKNGSANTIVEGISLKKLIIFCIGTLNEKGHTTANILVQPVEKITYDANSRSRFEIIKRHETELKWIKLLQTPYLLGFNDNIYHEDNLSKMPDFDVFSLLEFRKRTARSHGIKKNGNGSCKRKSRVQKLANCTLRDLATKLLHGRHCILSYLSSLLFQFYVVWILRLINFTIELTDYMMLLYLQGVTLNMLFVQPKLIIKDILSKFLLLIKVWTLLIYRAFSEINRYNHPY